MTFYMKPLVTSTVLLCQNDWTFTMQLATTLILLKDGCVSWHEVKRNLKIPHLFPGMLIRTGDPVKEVTGAASTLHPVSRTLLDRPFQPIPKGTRLGLTVRRKPAHSLLARTPAVWDEVGRCVDTSGGRLCERSSQLE
ncbi:hypothetical protein chiPu_0002135 [Chiloscyllium punctatum]|uniref:Uncharacterized protein n=1 Tax=Chiloscyllium punctatum TaxID=137246 RepID=A0A401S015_CHIPU|nr:hypothetical protein [Chiloscyllium punctatum]